MRVWPLLAALLLPLAPLASAQSAENILIHADEPLWRPGDKALWPQHFSEGDSFGCIHHLRLGIWRFVATKAEEADAPDESHDTFYSFGNYGVFHCHMNIAFGYEPDKFETSRPGFLVKVGDAGSTELWALQIGARPGSDYMLLSREPSTPAIERFNVLQQDCPRRKVRGGPRLDILSTRYCAVSSKRELLTIARRMAKLAPLGTLTFEQDGPVDD